MLMDVGSKHITRAANKENINSSFIYQQEPPWFCALTKTLSEKMYLKCPLSPIDKEVKFRDICPNKKLLLQFHSNRELFHRLNNSHHKLYNRCLRPT